MWKASLDLVLTYYLDKLTSPKWGKFWFLSSIWPWRPRSMNPKNKRHLNQGVLHFWSNFGECSKSGWQVIVWTNGWLMDTHTQTHTHTDRRRRWQYPKAITGHNLVILAWRGVVLGLTHTHTDTQTGIHTTTDEGSDNIWSQNWLWV